MPPRLLVSGAVEGALDQAVLQRIVGETGATITFYGGKGKQHLLTNLERYNEAARHAPWIVLIDLDTSLDCAPTAAAMWLPRPSEGMCIRIAVRQVESWLMGDKERLARFLHVSADRIPSRPDAVSNAKRSLVGAAARSKLRTIKQGVPPRQGSGRVVGPAYTTLLQEFVRDHWRPEIAAQHSESLARARRAIRRLIDAQG